MSEYDRLKAQFDAINAKQNPDTFRDLLSEWVAKYGLRETKDASSDLLIRTTTALKGQYPKAKPCANELWNTHQIAPRSCQRCGLGPCELGLVRKQA